MKNVNEMFLRNCWYAAAWDYEVTDNELLARTFLEKPIVIYKGDSGKYIALDNRCCHRAAPLSQGRIEGDCIRCMYHGMKYDSAGICVEIPGQDKISKSHRVRSYPIVEKGHLLWIWMGDPGKANPDDIHDYEPLTSDRWIGLPQQAYLHYDANWLLIVDNLADFSHLAFVHTQTLGGSEEYAYVSTAQEIERHSNGFSFERWHRDSAPPPYHARVSPEGDAMVDRRNVVTMLVPGIFFMETTFAPAGWDPQGSDMTNVRQYRNCQYMTPETRTTSHFFWNYLRDFHHDDESISISLQDSLLEGFMEDKVIIEAQQKLLNIDDPFQPRALQADAALSHFRLGLQKLIDEEREIYPGEQKGIRNAIM
ncbi:MAG: phenylpropionate dioxygenase-like ring-hydroxylating dioxygenase large terminal subunit [Woeseiaceae bacterium]|jgi:phenylpropionate dioxygenase-like ring-hydroxylating dioxygenase large terminal subunit